MRQYHPLFVWLVILSLLSIFYYEVIFQGKTLLGSPGVYGVMGSQPPWGSTEPIRIDLIRSDRGASAWGTEPWIREVGHAIRTGRLPLWTSHQGFGAPLAANAQAGAFDILRLPVALDPSPGTWDVYYLARAALGLWLSFACARALGLSSSPAYFLAIAYVFSGFMMILGNNHFIEVYLILPGTIWGTILLTHRQPVRGLLLISTTVSASVLAGMPEASFLAFALAAPFGAYILLLQALRRASFSTTRESGILLLVAWLIGLGLTAPMTFPFADYLGDSFHAHQPDLGLGLSHEQLPLMFVYGMPFLRGLPLSPLTAQHDIAAMWAGHTPSAWLGYTGATVLSLAGVGALSLRNDRAGRLAMFALASTILMLAKFFGAPGINDLGRLPGFNLIVISKWGAPLLALVLAWLAAYGVHCAAKGQLTAERLWVACGLFNAYLLVSLWLNWSLIEKLGRWHLLSTAGLAFALGLLTFLCVAFGRLLSHRLIAPSCCIIVTAELFFLSPHGVYQSRQDPYTTPPFVRFLESAASTYPPFRIFARSGILFPNTSTEYNIDDIRSLDALSPDRYIKYVATFLGVIPPGAYTGLASIDGGRTTPLTDNKYLDLTNVRFVIMPAGSSPQSDSTLAQAIVAGNGGPTPMLAVIEFTIDGRAEPTLLEHPPAEVTIPVTPAPGKSTLRFAPAIHPDVWSPERGDGVAFVVIAAENGKRSELFRGSVDPKNNPDDRHWREHSVDLTSYQGRPIQLILRTEPLQDPSYDLAGWGAIRFDPDLNSEQYKRVYQGEVDIYENSHALPRAFLVGAARTTKSEAETIAAMMSEDFDPRSVAVIESPVDLDLPAAPPTGFAGSAQVLKYEAQRVEISAQSDQPTVLVLTDMNFPGWWAEVDGRQERINPTNHAFRGVLLQPGAHTVIFRYEPRGVTLGLLVAGLAGLSLVITTSLLLRRRSMRRHPASHGRSSEPGSPRRRRLRVWPGSDGRPPIKPRT